LSSLTPPKFSWRADLQLRKGPLILLSLPEHKSGFMVNQNLRLASISGQMHKLGIKNLLPVFLFLERNGSDLHLLALFSPRKWASSFGTF
jgi:hypothetical protein